MTRNFADDQVSSELVDELLDLARRAPSAGNSGALEFLVLEGADQVASYWDVTLPVEKRASFPWPGLLHAPVLVVLWTRSGTYVDRYAESDKARTGLGESSTAWSTPYWFVDAGMGAMNFLLAAHERGLGALFFGVFDHEPQVREAFGVPADRQAVGAIAIGYPASEQRPSRSARRGRPPLDQIVHRGRW